MKHSLFFLICFLVCLLALFSRGLIHHVAISEDVDVNISQTSDQSDELTIYFHERRPFYVSHKNEIKGLVATPINSALKLTEIHYEWVEMPAFRQLEIIKSNLTPSCAVGWFKTKDRETYAKFSVPTYKDKSIVIVAKADSQPLIGKSTLKDVLDLDHLTLLTKKGYSYGKDIDTAIKSIAHRHITTTSDNYGMLKMIAEHRADYCLMTAEEAHDLLIYSELNRDNYQIINLTDVPEGNIRYLLCSQKVKDSTITEINSAIRHIIGNDIL